MASWIEEEFERRREEEFQATLRRPDALPLPPAEPMASFGERLSRVVSGWMKHAPATPATSAPRLAPARAIRRSDDEATVA